MVPSKSLALAEIVTALPWVKVEWSDGVVRETEGATFEVPVTMTRTSSSDDRKSGLVTVSFNLYIPSANPVMSGVEMVESENRMTVGP